MFNNTQVDAGNFQRFPDDTTTPSRSTLSRSTIFFQSLTVEAWLCVRAAGAGAKADTEETRAKAMQNFIFDSRT